MTAVAALLTSVITSAIIFLIIYAVYLWLSRKPSNTFVYFPSRILSGRELPDVAQWGPFQWIKELLAVEFNELPEVSGLDAAVYVYFQKIALYIILWAALFCVPILIPVCRTDDNYSSYNAEQTNPDKQLTYTDFDLLSLGNIKPKSDRLWTGAIAGWWLTLGALYFLYQGYRQVVDLRAHFFNSRPRLSEEQYTALVRDVPSAVAGDDSAEKVNGVEASVLGLFSRIYGADFLGAYIVPSLGTVAKPYKKYVQLRQKLAHSQGVLEAQDEDEKEQKRPQHKTGPLGLWGTKVDSIEKYGEEIEEILPALKDAQGEAKETAGDAAFVYFGRRQVAAMATQSLHAAAGSSWQVIPAPEPRDVEWSNLRIGASQCATRSYLVYFFVLLTVLFFMIPITFISSLTTLDNLRKTLPFLKAIIDIPSLKAILQAFLPQLALIVFLALLPPLLVFLSRLEGLPAKSHIVRAACGKYFYFMVFNVFLGVTLASSLFNSLKQVVKKPSSIVDTLASSLPQQASFFITFVALKFFISQGLELSRAVPLILYLIKKRFLCKTDYELKQAWAPGQLNYVTNLPNDLLILTIVIAYAVLAPLILPFGALYFLMRWAIMKHQAINVYVPAFESHGRMWPHMHNRAVAALFLAQLTIIGFFAIKKFPYAVILIPLPIVTLVYFFTVQSWFYCTFLVQSLDVASRDTGLEAPSVDVLKGAYVEESMKDPEEIGKEFFEKGDDALLAEGAGAKSV